MEKSRQNIADEGAAGKSFWYKTRSSVRHSLRVAVFSVAPIRWLLEREPASPAENKSNWNELLSDTRFGTYLGATIRIDVTNVMTATLIKYHSIASPTVLDVGCSGGTLPLTLASFKDYLGTDVSSHAIDVAEADTALAKDLESGRVRFKVTDLRSFNPEGATWDVMVFNEVLYYLKCDQAVEQVQRYANSLSVGGIICISMKNDGKSRAIFSMLLKKFDWIDGMLFQQKATKPHYSIDLSRERSAVLLGVICRKQHAE